MTTNKPVLMTVLVSAILGAAAMSGCMGISFDEDPDVAPDGSPVARLEANKDAGWSGETFTFNAQNSSDPNGEIVKWHFDFGDGHNTTVDRDDDARVEHRYTEGGAYTVTVTVIDNGDDQTGALSDSDAMDIVVNERLHVTGSVASDGANLTGGLSTAEMPFEGREDVERFELELDVQSMLLTGGSEIHIRVLDNETVLAEETVTLDAGQNETVLLEDAIVPGTYHIEITADDGAASFDGELRTYYGAVPSA